MMKGIILAIFLPYTEQSIVTARVISPMTRQTYALAFCTWTGYAPMFIAQEKGYFEEAGIDMTIQVIEDESTYAALITRGSVQFLATAQDPNIKMFANGANSRFVLTMDASNGADGLVTGADIQSLDDLAGKTGCLARWRQTCSGGLQKCCGCNLTVYPGNDAGID